MNTTTHMVAASESGDAASLAEFLSILQNIEIAKYTLVATFMLFTYDWLLTIDEEVFLVWPSRWGVPKVLFFLNRYFPFVDLILLTYVLMVGSDASSCVKIFQTVGGTTAFGFVIAQIVLTMRTWAIWGRRTWVTVLLSVLIATALAVDVYVLTRYLGGISFASLGALQAAYSGCPLQFSNRLVFIDFVIVIVTESVMLVLLVVKALEQFKHSRSTLMVRMFKDGVIYFIFILITSIANLVTVLSAPVELHDFLIITQRVLHSIFCTRVLLHIRGAYTNTALLSTTTAGSHMYTASGAHYAFRRHMSGVSRGTGETFELASVGVISGEVHGGDGAGWGMGHGFDGEGPFTLSRKDAEHGREISGTQGEDDPQSATTGTFSPFSSEVLYYEPHPDPDLEWDEDAQMDP